MLSRSRSVDAPRGQLGKLHIAAGRNIRDVIDCGTNCRTRTEWLVLRFDRQSAPIDFLKTCPDIGCLYVHTTDYALSSRFCRLIFNRALQLATSWCGRLRRGGAVVIEQNKSLVRRWFKEVWNEGREATIEELFAEDGVAYGLGDTETAVRGPAQLKVFVHNLRDSFPDIHISIEDILAEEEKVMVRVVLEGTHLGTGLGVPPTGTRIRVSGMVLVRVSKGRIAEGWNSWDQLGILRQIGALPNTKGEDQFLSTHS